MNHQKPDWECYTGHTLILPGLYLGGEDDVDQLLYGSEESRNLNSRGFFVNTPQPNIDVWIDLRDLRPSNRVVFVPDDVEHITFPFRDGNYEEAKVVLPQARDKLVQCLESQKRVLVTCHQGRSRSVILLLWYLSERFGSYKKAYSHIKRRRPLMRPDRGFKRFLEDWERQYG